MSEDLSTKFPQPPELQPISSLQAKIWDSLSLLLITGGLILLVTGGWMFYQNHVEANQPPPARILDSSELVDNDIDPLPVEPASSNVKATAISPKERSVTGVVQPTKPAVLEFSLSKTVDPVEVPESVEETVSVEVEEVEPVRTPVIEVEKETAPQETTLEPEIVSTNNEAPNSQERPLSAAEAKFLEETSLAQQAGGTGVEPAIETAPSLADNPLVVAEEVPAPAAAEASAPAEPASAVSATGSPPTRIVAESIDLDSDVVEVGWQEVIREGVPTNVWVVADYAAGWHRNSALPGQGDNIVLSGHHNINGEVFRYLVDIEVNDIISLYVGDQRYDYAVNDKFIVKDRGEPEAVRRANARWIGPFNEERITLVTCWPYNSNTHRLIVIAKPV